MLVALMLLGACVRSRITRFDPAVGYDRRTPVNEIRLFGEQLPRCEYKEIGRVTSEGGWLTRWGNVVRKARERARELGGDAIISTKERTRISGASVSNGGASTSESTSITGNVIRFTNPECRE